MYLILLPRHPVLTAFGAVSDPGAPACPSSNVLWLAVSVEPARNTYVNLMLRKSRFVESSAYGEACLGLEETQRSERVGADKVSNLFLVLSPKSRRGQEIVSSWLADRPATC